MTKILSFCPLVLGTLVLAIAAAKVPVSAQTPTVLYDFGSNSNDPKNPEESGVIAQGRDGNLYTTTATGGTSGYGTVFKITPQGNLTVLHNFDAPNGGPRGGLTLGADGNFYGTTYTGGTTNNGTVFKITPGGTLTVLYNFTGGSDGRFPTAPPIQGIDGNFYGTTTGALPQYGTLYRITSSGTFTPLHQFDYTNGAFPQAALVQGTDGNFYGTTQSGGPAGFGTVFQMTPSGRVTVLHFFDATNGYQPSSALVQGSDGAYYGTTQNDVFRITAAGTYTVLHAFAGGPNDGGAAFAGLVQATDGNFYGVTDVGGTFGFGIIFKVTSAGSYSVVYNFDSVTTGANPGVALFQNSNGLLYGDTYAGGPGSACGGFCYGTFYSLNLGLAPFITLSPASAKVGKTVEILGQGFTGTTAVSFNGTAAMFKVVSDTFLTATVPNGATTGLVRVTTPHGALKSSQRFRVTPQLLNFSPPSGPVGTVVTITGVSLTQTQGVGFGDRIPASFTVNSDTKVTATVPAGAKTGPVGVQTSGGTAISSATFTVTP